MAAREVQHSERELRLGLVLYGGVSLAIYMHGVAKELHKLVLASRAYEMERAVSGRPQMDGKLDDSEKVYYEQLKRVHEVTGSPLSVSIDIISGTSAGGINGVCLAKALAQYQTQEPLRRVWLKRGDIRQLVNGVPYLGTGVRLATALVDALVRKRAPLRGNKMIEWLYGVFTEMDQARSDRERLEDDAGSLVAAAEQLQLFVTTTDLRGYPRLVATGTGGAMQEALTYRHVLSFGYTPDGDGASLLTDLVPLTFAARATSSIPGAFEPLTFERFTSALAKLKNAPVAPLARLRNLFGDYECAGIDAEGQVFADGGVLENAPFSHVIKAIAAQPARHEVIRRIVYLEPDPASHDLNSVNTTAGRPLKGPPGPLAAVWQMIQGPRAHQPLLEDLVKLRDLNEEIEGVASIARDRREDVAKLVDTHFSAFGWPLDFQTLRGRVIPALQHEAREHAGDTYPTYQQLRLRAVAHWLADLIIGRSGYPADASQASFIRSVMLAWLLESQDWPADAGQQSGAAAGGGDAILASREHCLTALDIPYRQRRMDFVIAGINELYGRSREDRVRLGKFKEAAHKLLADLRRRPREALPAGYLDLFGPSTLTSEGCLRDPRQAARELRPQLDALASELAAALAAQPADAGKAAWDQFTELTGRDWAKADETSRTIIVRYTGFPLWDSLTYPVVALSELPQYTPIGTERFSPYDAKADLPIPGNGKLQGVRYGHFGAFFKLGWRQNDYLWGRLDGVQFVTHLLSQAATDGGTTPEALRHELERLQWDGLREVLGSETDLTEIRPQQEALVQKVVAEQDGVAKVSH